MVMKGTNKALLFSAAVGAACTFGLLWIFPGLRVFWGSLIIWFFITAALYPKTVQQMALEKILDDDRDGKQ